MTATSHKPAPRARRQNANDISEEIIRLIQARVFSPGDRLREQELAERFNLSRGPIREALRLLEARAVVRIEPMRGATVSRLSDREVQEAVEISGVLFGLSVRKAAGHLTPRQIERCRQRVDELRRLNQTDSSCDEFFQQTVRIGATIVEHRGESRLGRLLRDVRVGAPDMYGPLCFTHEALRLKAIEKWDRLVTAVEVGDSELCERLGREIHDDGLQAAMKVMGQSAA